MSTPIVEEKPKNRFIDPKVLIKIQNLELVARTVVEGFVQGLHRSPYMGFSVDFASYREYQPGDELRLGRYQENRLRADFGGVFDIFRPPPARRRRTSHI